MKSQEDLGVSTPFIQTRFIKEDFVVDSAVRAKLTVVWGVWKRFGSAFTYWYGGDGMARRSGGGDAYNAGKLMASSQGDYNCKSGREEVSFSFSYEINLERIDVRKPLIRRKKFLLGNKGYTYARIVHGKKELVLEWDLSVKAVLRRAMVVTSP
ncbi:hypothetical protein GOBAR_DD05261 [Gossypium barbadense]|nr:hypothetical protein GOBAR_DD05261 [Gossypium barbadense]